MEYMLTIISNASTPRYVSKINGNRHPLKDLDINSQRSLLIIAKTWNKTNKNIYQQENGNSNFSVVMECYYSALQKKELILIHPTKCINLQAWCCPKEIRTPHPLRIITDWFNQNLKSKNKPYRVRNSCEEEANWSENAWGHFLGWWLCSVSYFGC